MSDRQLLNAVYKECMISCERLQEEINAKRQRLETESFPSDISDKNRKSTTSFRIRRRLSGHYGKIYALHWSQHSETAICSASQDGKLMIWNAHTENKLIAIPLRSAWVMTCAYSPSGIYVSCGGLDNKVSIYNITDQNQGYENKKDPYIELEQHEGYISCVRFWDDGRLISSSGDSTLLLWDVTMRSPIAQFMDHTGDVMNVAVLPKRNVFVSVSCDSTAKIWDIRSKKSVGNFIGHSADVNCVDWFPDTYAFGTGSDDHTIKLFDTRAYRELRSYSNDQIKSGVTSLKFAKSGKYLIAGYDDPPFLLTWNTLNAVWTQRFNPPLSHRVSCLDLNCQGNAFATGSWDCTMRIWA